MAPVTIHTNCAPSLRALSLTELRYAKGIPAEFNRCIFVRGYSVDGGALGLFPKVIRVYCPTSTVIQVVSSCTFFLPHDVTVARLLETLSKVPIFCMDPAENKQIPMLPSLRTSTSDRVTQSMDHGHLPSYRLSVVSGCGSGMKTIIPMNAIRDRGDVRLPLCKRCGIATARKVETAKRVQGSGSGVTLNGGEVR